MFTFLHAADIHLDSPLRGLEGYDDAPVDEIRGAARRAFDNLITAAVEEKVDFLLLAGDLFDGNWKDYNTGLYFVDRMARLARKNIRVFLISGNHDAASQISKALRLPGNVHQFETQHAESVYLEDFGCVIHGQGYPKRGVSENLAREFPAADPHFFNIGLLHTSMTGREGHENYAPCSLDDLVSKSYDYWALGHVHAREVVSQDPMIIFAGCLQGRHIKETGEKGCTLVRVDNGRITETKHLVLDLVRWVDCPVDLDGCESLSDVLDICVKVLEDQQGQYAPRVVAVRLSLSGTCPVHSELCQHQEHLVENLRGLTASLGEMWLEKVVIRTVPPQIIRGRGAAPMESLLESIETAHIDIDTVAEFIPDIVSLKTKLPPMIHSDGEHIFDFVNNADENFIGQVKELLLGKLRRL